jgi:hypothetical protein
MILRYQHDKYKDLLCPLPSRMWWCYTGLPPLPAPAKNVKRDGPTSPSPEIGRRGGGTGKSAHVEWRREQKIFALTWQGWGAVQDVQKPHLHKFYQQI